MRRSLLLLATLAASAGAAAPAAAAPFEGARYGGAVPGAATCPGCGVSGLELAVADDGRSLLSARTRASVTVACTGRGWSTRLNSDAPVLTAVGRDRRFAWRDAGVRVRGRFSRDGRIVRGTVTVRRGVRGGRCTLGPLPFAVRRGGRPHRAPARGVNLTCDTVLLQPVRLRAVRRGRGCTPVTRAAAAWRKAAACRTADGLPRACVVAGRRCVPVARGRLSAAASVACRNGRERFELEVERFCRLGAGNAAIGAVRTACTDARRVMRAAEGGRAVAGWRCHPFPWRGCTRGRAHVWVEDWPFDDFAGDADG